MKERERLRSQNQKEFLFFFQSLHSLDLREKTESFDKTKTITKDKVSISIPITGNRYFYQSLKSERKNQESKRG